MDGLGPLLARRSVHPRFLSGPGPTQPQIEAALDVAARAPDHGQLCPFRFTLVQRGALARLADLLERCALERDPATPPEQIAKFRLPPTRAPLAIVVSAALRAGHKVPETEQLLCTGAAVMNLLDAFHLQGYGAIWLTGPNAYDPAVATALGLPAGEKLLGFVYVGTPDEQAPGGPPRPPRQRFVRTWLRG